MPDNPFNPNIRDGLRTRGLSIDKTNWANRLDQPPFEACQVTCGITFTFGGLRVTCTSGNVSARVPGSSPMVIKPSRVVAYR
ncbi:MAG: hypothetical protein ACLQFR_07755 [Streptosporangiaceae bacterium]